MQQAIVGFADITLLFSSITNCISTFNCIQDFHFFLQFFAIANFNFNFNSLASIKFVQIREFYEFLKFIKFAFSVYDS